MMIALKEEVIKREIETLDEIMITSLIMDEFKESVIGATGISLQDSKLIVFKAKSVVMACGGAGWLYPVTSNTLQKTGDGYSLAYDAGADSFGHGTGSVPPNRYDFP